ncbi:MAG: PBECR2 nuclease fold domain-containing protein [Proteobacteria bacterium]|nr:PBECR2 nuclease fold domain-containing protein [Pseudomonadota bacterium]
MPEPRSGSSIQVLPDGLSERDYLTQFMREFGSDWNEDAQITTETGHELLISREMFTDHKTGMSKMKREGRFHHVLFISDTIKNPDEIRLELGGYQDETLYLLSRYTIRGKLTHIITAFKKTGSLWTGWSGYQSTSETYFETKRNGALLYRRV